MARPIHYASVGVGGLVFDCWRREYEPHRVEQDKVEAERMARRARGDFSFPRGKVPLPQVRSDLRLVTCPECWRQIAAMARVALAQKIS